MGRNENEKGVFAMSILQILLLFLILSLLANLRLVWEVIHLRQHIRNIVSFTQIVEELEKLKKEWKIG